MRKSVFVFATMIILILVLAVAYAKEGRDSGSDDDNDSSDRTEKEIEFKEKIRSGEIEFKVRGKNITISDLNDARKEIILGKINLRTGLNLTIDDLGNKTLGQVLRAYLSNGRWAEVKIMPDSAAEIALKRLQAKCEMRDDDEDDDELEDADENETEIDDDDVDCKIELKEVGKGNNTHLAYEITTDKNSTLLLFFKKKMLIKAEVDAETGEIISLHRPWWSFLAKEKNSNETEIESDLNGTRAEKVTICHKPIRQGVTITIAKPALRAHLRHGDSVGACTNSTTPIPPINITNQTEQNNTNIDTNITLPDNNQTLGNVTNQS